MDKSVTSCNKSSPVIRLGCLLITKPDPTLGRYWILAFAFVVSACTSAQRVPEPAPTRPAAQTMNLSELKNRLNMSRAITVLGFREARINHSDYLTSIHFRLYCRESEGTVDTMARTDLIPLEAQSISYRLGNFTGSTSTDRDGFGQIEVIRPRSARADRLRLTIDDRFVATPALEASRIVVPDNWCPR